jgi:hypothetical protein
MFNQVYQYRSLRVSGQLALLFELDWREKGTNDKRNDTAPCQTAIYVSYSYTYPQMQSPTLPKAMRACIRPTSDI